MIGLAAIDIDIDGFPGFLFMILFGVICAGMADSKGRNAVGWFIGGFLFHLLALILLALLPNLKEEAQRHGRHRTEASRIRERQRHDRSVNDRRYGEIERRLRAHDVALGLDTSPQASTQALEGTRPPELPSHDGESAWNGQHTGRGPDRVWYFSNDARSRSAAPAHQLRSLYQDGRINGGTLVWTEGMHDWRNLSDVPELEAALRG